MNGRLEKEQKLQNRIEEKLKGQPEILRTYYTYLRANKKAFSSIDVYLNYVISFMKFVTHNSYDENFYKVNIESIEKYLISMETSRKVDGTIKRINTDIQAARWSGLKNFYDFLVKRGYYVSNPIDKTSRPSTTNNEHNVTYLTRQEIKKIMDGVDKNPYKITAARDKTIIGLGLATGLRAGAIIGLNIEDIDFDNNVIHVIEKRNKVRNIEIGEQTAELLRDWIAVRGRAFKDVDTNALFISQKHNRISPDAINNMIQKYTKEAGIAKHITAHKLRSSSATNLAAAGVSIQAIAKQLGHSNIAITQRYVDVLKEEKEKTIKVLDNLF